MGEPGIAGEEHRVERLGERDVDGIVSGQPVAQGPDPAQERLVRVAFQVERAEVLESRRPRGRVELSGPHETPQRLSDLDVGQVRDVETERGVGDSGRDRAAALRPEQELDEGRRIEDDHRALRSVRITAVRADGGVAGEMTCTSLGSVHRPKGTLRGSTLTFTETEAIRPGNATLGTTYTVTLSGAGGSGTYSDPVAQQSGTIEIGRP
mgnify:CR=1 FL=1